MRFGEVLDSSIFSNEVMGFEERKIPLYVTLRHSARFEIAIFHGLHADPPALPHIWFKPGFDKRDASCAAIDNSARIEVRNRQGSYAEARKPHGVEQSNPSPS